MSEEESQEDTLGDFAGRVLRRNMPGSYEQLLCQHLIKSVAANPIEKIRLVCEAAMMVPNTPVDTETLETIYNVVTSFSQSRLDIKDPYDSRMWHGIITWSFDRTGEAFERYITPWMKDDDAFYIKGFSYNDEKKEEFNALEFGPRKFFWGCERIHIAGLAVLEARFMAWAMPQVMVMFEQLSKLVSPDLYMEMLEKVRG